MSSRYLTRRRCLAAGWGAVLVHACPAVLATPSCASADWPLWQGYVHRFIQADGRVIDDQFDTHYTTSEGQAYSLFFCLVSGERERFEVLLRWTEVHLAQGDLHARLPGWRWGRDPQGTWGLLDANSATDADLWLAHTLFEAARRWQEPRYRDTALAIVQRVQQDAVVRLPELGPLLLPAPQGFHHVGPDGESWRFNPSYMPLHQLRAFAREDPGGPWAEMVGSTLALLRACAQPAGFVPDWIGYSRERGWHPVAPRPGLGSYDAIRTYLWAGVLSPHDPLRRVLIGSLFGMREWLTYARLPPQQVMTDSGQAPHAQEGPVGFSAALLPYLYAAERPSLWLRQAERVAASIHSVVGRGPVARPDCRGGVWVGEVPTYYDQVLSLFGLGALEGRYAFGPEGELLLGSATATACSPMRRVSPRL